MTSQSAAGLEIEDTERRGTVLHRLRGGSCVVGSGRPSTMHTSNDGFTSDAVANPIDQYPMVNLAVDLIMENPTNRIENNPYEPSQYPPVSSNPEVPMLHDSSFQNTLLNNSQDNPPPYPPTQNTTFRNSRGATKMNCLPRSTSPPPIMRTSVPDVSLHSPPTGHLHNSLVV